MAEPGWYYVSQSNRVGPVESAEISRLIEAGQIQGGTLVWREGLEGWDPASDHFAVPKGISPPPIPGMPPLLRQSQSQGVKVGALANPYGNYIGAPPRGFVDAIGACMRKYVSFGGRASRSEYWYFILFGVLVSIGCAILDAGLSSGYGREPEVFQGIAALILLLPNLAVTVRRLHDSDRSGWWIGGFWLAMLVLGFGAGLLSDFNSNSANPDAGASFVMVAGLGFMVYFVVVFVFLCQRGTAGPNRHG